MAKPRNAKTAKKGNKKAVNDLVEKNKAASENLEHETEEETEMDQSEDEENVENQSPNVQQDDDTNVDESFDATPEIPDDAPAEVVKKAPVKAQKSAKAAKSANVEEDRVAFKRRAGVIQKKKRSLSNRAGLLLPVARIRKNLRKFASKHLRIQVGAAVYLAGVLEYLNCEILELSGNIAKTAKKVRINPRYLLLAIKQDEELDQLLKHVTIASGGVFKTVHPALLPKDSRSKKMDTSD